MKTILLVDDDLQVRAMFSMALRRNGYRVIEASSGDAGLLMARQHLPDLILTDIHMPGGDGSTLLHDIRLDPELRSKQVVLMTGRPDLVTPRKGMEEGADDFLVKPVNLEALLNCLKARFSRASINWRVEDERLAQLRSSTPSQLPHEFFTPLAGIIGLVDILRSDASALTADEIGDIYSDLHQSALRLHRTIRNYLLILDLQNAKDDAPVPSIPALSSREVEQNILAGAEEALRLNDQRRKDATIRMSPCSISIKPADLSHVVEELVDNAFKFSRQGTPVGIELNADGLLTVTDQGRGMSAEEIGHIGAFQQFDRKKNEQQGLGLGLVLVQKIAALCEAKFSLSAEAGKGTRVQISFPLAQTDQTRAT
jgi:signal transduction histidine kinase